VLDQHAGEAAATFLAAKTSTSAVAFSITWQAPS